MQETSKNTGFRLSPQQKRLWFLQQDSSVYCVQCAIAIAGNIDSEILQASLEKVVNRHEILRTSFHLSSKMKVPFQVIGDRTNLSWHEIDLMDLNLSRQKAEIEGLVQQERCRLFDLEKEFVLHIYLVKLSSQKHVLLMSLPALFADTASLNNLTCELSRCYKACLEGEEFIDETIQYVDFSEWQNELLEAKDTEIGREYWRKQNISDLLDFNLSTKQIATDENWEANNLAISLIQNPKSKIQNGIKLPFEKSLSGKSALEPKILNLTIEIDLFEKIKTLVQNNNSSLNLFLFACWQILLWRISGQTNMLVSNAYDGRNHQELVEGLGLYAKYLPIRSHLQESLPFGEFLEQVDRDTNEAYKWQECFSWDETIASAFVPFGFDFITRSQKYNAAGATFSLDWHYACIDRFKIKLSCIEKDDRLLAEFHYDANLYSIEEIERLAGQFRQLLESAIANLNAAIDELVILSDRDRQQLLIEFNDTKRDYPKDKCIHQLFEERAKLVPDQIAVVFEDRQLTYGELNARANQLARHLQTLGVKPDVLVGICVERSLDMVIGILGILKAGGAYVPIDPVLPKERIAFMLEDTQASVLLTQQHLMESLPDRDGANIICLDADWDAIACQSQENPAEETTSENLAYIIYTSGSTGKPKGVAIEHRQLVNYVNGIVERLEIQAGASYAMVSTFAADLGNTVVFPSLCTGGSLHIISQERVSNPDLLAEYFRRNPIDCLKIVPAHLEALMSYSHPEQILPRQRLVLGGETSNWNLIENIQALAPDCVIFNHYGPTETTVGAIAYRVETERKEHRSSTLPLGRPLANAQIYILDRHLQPVPIGVPGELYIGGLGLARCYLNRPELTKEKFIVNPFSNDGSRLYKTGDLARYLSDGAIEFLGRLDNQVKIRGFRIELGEIEAILSEHPKVRQTVVIIQSDRQRIVAYVVPNEEQLTTSELQSSLKERLPDYMMPSAIAMLQSLPLTPNGKIDRRALPAPDTSNSERKVSFALPRSAIEEKLAEIWAEVLGQERISIYDNFFELGGDSILSIGIVAKANRAGLKLTPVQLFQYQTIAELAAVVGETVRIHAEQDMVTGSVPLTPIQHYFFEQKLPESHHFNMSVLLEVPSNLKSELLEQVVEQLLLHHDALRLRFNASDEGWKQFKADFDKQVPFNVVDLSALSPTEQSAAIEKASGEVQASLNISDGSIMRVVLFQLGLNLPSRLLLAIHHLAIDGVSWRILIEDLVKAYQQLSNDEVIQLSAKTTSFKDWANRLNEYGRSAIPANELDFWLTQSSSHIAPIPVDYPKQEVNTVASSNLVSVSLSESLTRALLQEVPAAYNTQINDVLLSALLQCFAQWTKAPYLHVELEGHGREELFENVDLSRTVGWFTTRFPVLLESEDINHPGEALKSVKEQLRRIPIRGIGYGVLRYLAQDAATRLQLQTLPTAQVSFNYLGQFDRVLSESPGWQLAKESTGLVRSPLGKRRHLLEVDGLVESGKLQINWTYSENVHQRSTIERLAQDFIEALESLIAHCQFSEAGGYTPSDFPEADLSQQELDELVAKLAVTGN
ncbi:MAG: amino acid adenylation domain-containing protein [Hydrococcus sp. Prado102]|nr:amino acid adenylation domain-containing protein [Hydrococcus sp. Prado102]